MAKTLGEVLEFESFAPEQMDIADIQELSDSIPRDGHVDIPIAESLAVRFLRGADTCSEILCKIVWWLAKKEGEAQHAYTKAMLVKAGAAGHKTAKEKEKFASGDAEYLKASEEVARAKAMKKWLENKHSSLISAHYLMKDIAKGNIRGRDAEGGVASAGGTRKAHGAQPW